MKRKENESVKVFALGGVGEIGKNMYCVEIDSEIFIVDAGLMFPGDEMFGIDIVIPDITYLVENQERVKGLFITHGHEDHIGGIVYVLRKLSIPVYATKLTVGLIQEKLGEAGMLGRVDLKTIDSNSTVEFNTTTVSFFGTTHSIRILLAFVSIHQKVQSYIRETLNSIKLQLEIVEQTLVKWHKSEMKAYFAYYLIVQTQSAQAIQVQKKKLV